MLSSSIEEAVSVPMQTALPVRFESLVLETKAAGVRVRVASLLPVHADRRINVLIFQFIVTRMSSVYIVQSECTVPVELL